jgi:hypothetical protein
VADVVLAVQGECDAQGLRLLQRYLEARRVAEVAGDAARHQAGGSGGGRGEGPDPRWAGGVIVGSPARPHARPAFVHADALAQPTPPTVFPSPFPQKINQRAVEHLVQEIVLLIQRSEEYNTFMVAKMRAAITEHFANAGHQQQQQQQQQGEERDAAARAAGDKLQPQPSGGLGRRGSLVGASSGGAAAADGGAVLGGELAQQAAAAQQAAEAKFRGGPFNVCVREIVSHYMALEEYYMESTAAMAVRIDQLERLGGRGACKGGWWGVASRVAYSCWILPGASKLPRSPAHALARPLLPHPSRRRSAARQVPDALTSSMVDDAFYILKKCGSRAMATGNVQCVAALLGELNDLLANSYRGALQVGGRAALGWVGWWMVVSVAGGGC